MGGRLGLRPTRKLRPLLATLKAQDGAVASDTALGDWYANRVVVLRQPLLLLVSSTSLLPALIRAVDVKSLPDRLGDVIAARLRRLGVPDPCIEGERRAMVPVVIDKASDRSVVGSMVDFAHAIPFHQLPSADVSHLAAIEWRLGEIPCRTLPPRALDCPP